MSELSTRRPLEASRRDFIAIGAALPLATAAVAADNNASGLGEDLSRVTLHVNGEPRIMEIDPRTTLLDALREHLGLTGTKKGCDHGQCGACTVIVEGRRMNACLSLAVMHEGDTITTIEGLGRPTDMHPMQAAFVRHDGFQCGYCTPGQIMSAVAMLNEFKAGWASHVTRDVASHPEIEDEEIRERMSGNLCRCAAYPNILSAIKNAGGHR